VERLARGEGEAVPVNRIEPRIVPHEPDPDLLADAQRLDGRPPDEHGQRRKLSENVRCDRISHPHVGKVRRSLEQTDDVETVSTSTDTKGRKQPRTKKRPKVPREVATHSHQDVGPESPGEIARKLARLEELESTTRRLERENIRLKSESATLSVDAFIGAGREERRRFLDGVGLDSLLDAMSADMLAALHQRLVAQYRGGGARPARVGGSDTGRSRHLPKPSPSSTSGEGARAVNRAERRRLRAMGERVDQAGR
jgi:hypothetical protein